MPDIEAKKPTSIDMEALAQKKPEETTFAELV